MADTPSRLLTVAEACTALRIARSTLYEWMADGRLTYTQIGPRTRRIPEDAIEDLIARGAPDSEVSA